ncbi:MAG: amino acid adenylation domain-containing protein [Woeseiaceae bacterium]
MSQPPFLDRIAQSAEQHGARPALISGGTEVSYKRLFATARGIRDEIIEQGFGHAKRIGIVTSVSIETYASLLAVWSLGAAYVPLNSHNPVERNARIIERARLNLILTSRVREDWSTYLPDAHRSPRVLSTRNVRPGVGRLEFPEVERSALAYIFFTSGSTGTPKGVPISHANLSAFMNAVLTDGNDGFIAEDRFLQMFERTFDLSIVSFLAPWSVGACCCVVPEGGIHFMNILKVLSNENVTVALMVPSVLPYMQRFFDEVRLPALRLSQFCGEPLMQDMVSGWSQCVPNACIENVYGPTEATIYCTKYLWEYDRANTESVNGIVPIGRPMAGTRTLVLDEQAHHCPVGTRGELCLVGEQVMTTYWNDRKQTAASFLPVTLEGNLVNAYRTGDIAYENANGNLIYCGRLDSQVKIDGHRIELGEIEYFARRFIGSSTAVVVVTRDDLGAQELNLFIGGSNIDRRGLEECLKENLPEYMLPSSTIVLPELPLNLNGKIDRQALARMSAQ